MIVSGTRYQVVLCLETLFVYYGSANKHVGLATCPVAELREYVLSCPVGQIAWQSIQGIRIEQT